MAVIMSSARDKEMNIGPSQHAHSKINKTAHEYARGCANANLSSEPESNHVPLTSRFTSWFVSLVQAQRGPSPRDTSPTVLLGLLHRLTLDYVPTTTNLAAQLERHTYKSATAMATDEGPPRTSNPPIFFKLPPELRNRIYEEAFGTTVTRTPLHRRLEASEGNHGIILACKQTYSEAIGLYYSCSTFKFSGESDAFWMIQLCVEWLGNMWRAHRGMIERIEFDTLSMDIVKGQYQEEALKDAGRATREKCLSSRIAETAFHLIETVHRHFAMRIGVLEASIMKQTKPGNLEHHEIVYTGVPMQALENHWKAAALPASALIFQSPPPPALVGSATSTSCLIAIDRHYMSQHIDTKMTAPNTSLGTDGIKHETPATDEASEWLSRLSFAPAQHKSSVEIPLDSASKVTMSTETRKGKPNRRALTASKQHRKRPSYFLRLPPELCNRIYEEAFNTTVTFSQSYNRPPKWHKNNGIVLVCRQTHRESIGLYYICHTFNFSGSDNKDLAKFCITWLRNIKGEHRKLIRHIELDTFSLVLVRLHYSSYAASGWYGPPDRATCFSNLVAEFAQTTIDMVHRTTDVSSVALKALIIKPLWSAKDFPYEVTYTVTPVETLDEHWKKMNEQTQQPGEWEDLGAFQDGVCGGLQYVPDDDEWQQRWMDGQDHWTDDLIDRTPLQSEDWGGLLLEYVPDQDEELHMRPFAETLETT
ncbi:hypothetical protein CBER1_03474 [Cercospora berteroae]|uniref:Uncharacterized protein n=1 Tax=Cercospora berteroae TaxID=357750 RepID=A0A2S6CLV4_9PEZI|nr:hypothetical protein CBER1_03474 [Cercospora berteroae]